MLEKIQRYGAVDLAKQIKRILNAPFQSVIPTQPQVGQWNFPIISTSGERATLDDEECNENIQVRSLDDAGAQQGGQSKYSIVFSATQSNRLQDSANCQEIP